jgi:hypothetical protein
MIRTKVESMFKTGKSTKQIADFFGLPTAIIEEMICTPPVKVLGGFPNENDRTRTLYQFKHKYGMLKEKTVILLPVNYRAIQQKIDKDKIEGERLAFFKQQKEQVQDVD